MYPIIEDDGTWNVIHIYAHVHAINNSTNKSSQICEITIKIQNLKITFRPLQPKGTQKALRAVVNMIKNVKKIAAYEEAI